MNLPGDHALDGVRRHFFVDAFFPKPAIERRSNVFIFLPARLVFIRLIAKSIFC
jgi:hypothetical protein